MENILPLNKQLVLFDGVCNMCDSTVRFIIKHDKKEHFVFASLQGETANQILDEVHVSGDRLGSIVLYNHETCYTKSSAVLKITAQLKPPINLLLVFLIVPKFLRDFVYDIIKQRRYQWFGKKTACAIPSPELRARFLP